MRRVSYVPTSKQAMTCVLGRWCPPQVDALYSWALQVDLADVRGIWGSAHTGLQWNPRYVEGKAVNFGGYFVPELGGGVLTGTAAPFGLRRRSPYDGLRVAT
jgi:hypothetical protein